MAEDMSIKDRLIKARIQIQRSNPFFAYLSLYLKFIEVEPKKKSEEGKEGKGEEGEDLEGFGMGVDVQGNLYYSADFIKKQNDRQLIGVLIHEILHLSFLHHTRTGNRNHELSNVAMDIVVNNVLTNNGYELPEGGLIPRNNEINLDHGKINVVDIDKKLYEQVYDELQQQIDKNYGPGAALNMFPEGFDLHMKAKGKNGQPLTETEKRQLEKSWQEKVNEAATTAKMKGNLPSGMELLLGKLHENRVNWKALLQRYVLSYIPYDRTYSRCNKKSVSAGYYVPDYLKEKIKVVVAIDTSGSIGQPELIDFLSEIKGMAKGFKDRIDMVLITHDTEVKDDYLIENGNVAKLEKVKIHGGGGTSHQQVFEHILEKHKDTKLALCFTDGYSDLDNFDMNKFAFDKIFIINKNGTEEQVKNKRCKVIKLT